MDASASRATSARASPAGWLRLQQWLSAVGGSRSRGAPMTSRIQLALNVRHVETATRFYAEMFGVPPAKQRPGYANFVIADPPLKLVLFENPGAAATALNHLGVEVA